MFKQFVAFVAAGVIACVFAGQAMPAADDQSPHDFAVGSIRVSDVFAGALSSQHTRFSAHSGPAGEDPSGYVVFDLSLPGAGFIAGAQGHVTCLQVDSVAAPGGGTLGQALIAAELDQPVTIGPVTYGWIFVIAIDGGDSDQADFVASQVSPVPPVPGACALFGFTLPGDPRGNVVVHDATP